MSISEHMYVSKAEGSARRIEIFTGAGRRRSWSAEEKAAIVAESCEGGAKVCHVARRHGLTPQQLFGWRQEARRKSEAAPGAAPFVPVLVEPAEKDTTPPACRMDEESSKSRPHAIEVEIDGASVFIWRDAEAAMVKAIISVLKAGK